MASSAVMVVVNIAAMAVVSIAAMAMASARNGPRVNRPWPVGLPVTSYSATTARRRASAATIAPQPPGITTAGRKATATTRTGSTMAARARSKRDAVMATASPAIGASVVKACAAQTMAAGRADALR